jgi:large subunit ribosomal protein L15
MSLHELRAAPGARKDRRRLGRGHGSGRGKTGGKGTKGQQARAGKHIRPGFEGGALPMIMRMPFKRGIGFFNPNAVTAATINIRQLGGFEPNTEVTLDELEMAKLIPTGAAKVKVLGDGDLDRPLTVKAHAFSASAKAKIEAAGGQAIVIGESAQ